MPEPEHSIDGAAPLTLTVLAGLLQGQDEATRWRLVAEFIEGYRWLPLSQRWNLIVEQPPTCGDQHWDVFLAALAEHLRQREGKGAPPWAHQRCLENFWFPYNSAPMRAQAMVYSPAAFRRRGIFVPYWELEVA